MKYILALVMFDCLAAFAICLVAAVCNISQAVPALAGAVVAGAVGYCCAWKLEKLEEAEL